MRLALFLLGSIPRCDYLLQLVVEGLGGLGADDVALLVGEEFEQLREVVAPPLGVLVLSVLELGVADRLEVQRVLFA